MSVIGELLVEINGDNSGLKKSVDGAKKAFGTMADVQKDFIRQVSLVALAWGAVDLAMKGIDYNKAAEQAEIAFGVFLGSATAAKDMIEEMRDLAKETPLEFAEVRDAGKRLAAFGIEADKLIPTMRTLADVSAGLQIPIGDLAYLFGTIKTQGRAMTVDINQFANRGIPIWEELAKVTGKAGTELRKLVEEGGVGFPQIEQAFQNMTGEGGKFFNMAVKQMDSLAGSQSNLNDAFDVWLGSVTRGLAGPLKDLNNMLAAILTWDKDALKGWTDLNEPINKWAATLYGVKKTQKEILDDAKSFATALELARSSAKAAVDAAEAARILAESKKKEALEAAKILAINRQIASVNETMATAIAWQNGSIATQLALIEDQFSGVTKVRDMTGETTDFMNLTQQLAFATNLELDKTIDNAQSITEEVEKWSGQDAALVKFKNDVEAIDAATKKWDDTTKAMGETLKGIYGTTFEALGEALYNNEQAWKSLAKGALQAIAAIIKGIGDQLTAMAAADVVKAWAAIASVVGAPAAPGFFASAGILGAGAAGAYTAAGVLNAIELAQGGIVPGNSISGDNVPAMVNSREMMLTMEDQKSLLAMIRGGGYSGDGMTSTINIYWDSVKVARETVKLVDNGIVEMKSLKR